MVIGFSVKQIRNKMVSNKRVKKSVCSHTALHKSCAVLQCLPMSVCISFIVPLWYFLRILDTNTALDVEEEGITLVRTQFQTVVYLIKEELKQVFFATVLKESN